ncbi:MAG: EAL domain-containing protein [Granulosicoccus sp.]|nr:EAL domain-containing protein [Granulosicoccus sp.]
MFRRHIGVPLVLFAVAMSVGFYLVQLSVTVDQTDQQLDTQQLLSTQAAEIERSLTHALSSTYILAQEIVQGNGEIADFDQYAESVLEQFPAVTNLQLAPNGIISQIYPLAGHEAAIGHNLLLDESRKFDAKRAIDSHDLTLAGPIELVQGGVAVIGRNPVFIEQQHNREFWGFVSALVLLDELMARAGIRSLTELGYGYELSRLNPVSNQEEVFATGELPLMNRQQHIEFSVPNGNWTLRVDRHDDLGWQKQLPGYLMSFVIALIIAVLSRKVIVEPEQLRQQVAVQTGSLQHLAYHDHLTGLPNRLSFSEILQLRIDAARHRKGTLSLLLIDLDQFKEVNDSLGHDVGDQLLIEAVRRMQACLSGTATLARLGGDEFTVIVDHENGESVSEELAQNIIDSMTRPFLLNGQSISISASVGIVQLSEETGTATELLKYADLAMYDAKNRGRSVYCHYTASLQDASLRRLRLTNDLKDAITNDELHLVYQPIVCVKTGRIEKAEALIRWSHPEFGIINPLEFIPLAESSGLILSIGEWIFRTAALQVKHWRNLYYPGFQISVNASPIQFRSDSHTSGWINCLSEMQLDGSSILIEITEGILLDDCPDMRAQIEKLRAVGVQFALDDFGTGYSSLSYLKSLPIDYLKIDRSFVSNLGSSAYDMFLCEVMIMLANRFGLKVVAEGVESNEQYELLTQEECDYVQGYYFSKPESAEEIEARFLSDTTSISSMLNTRAA